MIAQIQERDDNYRDVAKLATMVRQKRRQQRWQERLAPLTRLKRLPVWSWLIIMLVPLALWGMWSALGGDNGTQDEVAAFNATATAQMQAVEATQTVSPTITSEPTPTATRQPIETATVTPEPTLTVTPSRTPTAAPTVDPNVPPADATLGDTWTRPADDMVMVYVPPPDAPFVLESGVEAPQEVYWLDAMNYTAWLNEELPPEAGWEYVLPTEAEWEYAAVGDSGAFYPWGNEESCELANYLYCGVGGPVAVDSYPEGASWVGALNMAGNVLEWTSSWYDEDQDSRVLRGGSWLSNYVGARAPISFPRRPTDRSDSNGFRVVVRRPPISANP